MFLSDWLFWLGHHQVIYSCVYLLEKIAAEPLFGVVSDQRPKLFVNCLVGAGANDLVGAGAGAVFPPGVVVFKLLPCFFNCAI
jgi:hypothetical protein